MFVDMLCETNKINKNEINYFERKPNNYRHT